MLAWRTATLAAIGHRNPKKLPKTPSALWAEAPDDPVQALAAAFGRPGGVKDGK